jgi:hypothetical protein
MTFWVRVKAFFGASSQPDGESLDVAIAEVDHDLHPTNPDDGNGGLLSWIGKLLENQPDSQSND